MLRPLLLPAVALLLATGLGVGGEAPVAGEKPNAGSGPPGAWEILERVRRAYAGLTSYRDRGEIEIDTAERRTRLRFATAARAGGGFRFELEPAGGEGRQVIWREGGQGYHYDARSDRFRRISVPAALGGLLGEPGAEALVVPALLAGRADAFPEAEAAAVVADDECEGSEPCWVVRLSSLGGVRTLRLWIGRERFLIHRLELADAGWREALRRAAAAAGLEDPAPPPPAGSGPAGPVTLRVRHRIGILNARLPDSQLTFAPPPPARLVEAGDPEVGEAIAPLVFGEEIAVDLVTVEVRVVDGRGRPVLGLGAADFVVLGGVRPVPVVAAEWRGADAAGPPSAPEASGAPGAADPTPAAKSAAGPAPGRLVTLFVQADNNAPGRTKGHLRTFQHLERFLAELPPADRVAVVSFDSHLKLRLDFTRDREAAREAVWRGLHFGGKPVLRDSRSQLLAPRLDPAQARAAATPERALELVAYALADLDGEKLLVFLGWGLGARSAGGFRFSGAYERAVAALEEARVPVYVLDVSSADYHTLELGLRQVAADTGGTYGKTFRSPGGQVDRLAETLGGHYLLTLDPAALPPGRHRLEIALRGGDEGTVQAPVFHLTRGTS